MELKYKVTGSERKRLVMAMAEHLECDAKYLGMPTAAYQVGYFTIDKNGTVSFDDHADSAENDEVEQLVEWLLELGFEPEGTQNGEREEMYGLTISIPRDLAPDAAIENLKRMLQAKGPLIKKAIGADNTDLVVDGDVIRFPWFRVAPGPDMISAVSKLIGRMLAEAKAKRRVTSKEKSFENEKYAFRCFLLRLGFIGDAYKPERKLLLGNLAGSSAYKNSAKKPII